MPIIVPFDCSGDPCHLAWIIDENRHLLDNLAVDFRRHRSKPRCSNGTYFHDLDRQRFTNCRFSGQ